MALLLQPSALAANATPLQNVKGHHLSFSSSNEEEIGQENAIESALEPDSASATEEISIGNSEIQSSNGELTEPHSDFVTDDSSRDPDVDASGNTGSEPTNINIIQNGVTQPNSKIFVEKIVRQRLSDNRIVGGRNEAIKNSPWQVALIWSDASSNFSGQFCGGSIISPFWVITAAHCVDELDASDVRVLAGTSRLSHTSASGANVSEILVHPSYTSSSNGHDIALLGLEAPFRVSGSIRPIAIASSKPNAGVSAKISGWGGIEVRPPWESGNSYLFELQAARIAVMPDSDCRTSYLSYNAETMLCAGDPRGFWIDTCQGDSGGPLVTGSGSNSALAGITSFGRGCAWLDPGVYTNVANYRGWILENATLPSPSLSSATSSATGFTLTVVDYSNTYSYRAEIVGGTGRVSLGRPSGLHLPITVTGIPPGQSRTLRVSKSIGGFSLGSAEIVASADPVVSPQLSVPVSTATGFIFAVENYDRAYKYRVTLDGPGRVKVGRPVGSTLPVTVTGVAPGDSRTVTVVGTLSGVTDQSQTVASADPVVSPQLSVPVSTATGFIFAVENYDRAYKYRVTLDGPGRVKVGRPVGSTLPVTVTGVAPGDSRTVTVVGTLSGVTDQSQTVGFSIPR